MSEPPIKVVHVITGLEAGGAQAMLLKLLSSIDRDRFTPSVVSLSDEGSMGGHIRDLGIPLSTMGLRPGRVPIRSFGRLVLQLRKTRPEIVQTWLYHSDLVGGLAARAAGVHCVAWGLRQNRPLVESTKRHTRATVRACAALSHRVPVRIVAVSEGAAAAHACVGYDADRMVVIPNGFDTDRFRPDPIARGSVRSSLGVSSDSMVVGCVARLHPDKGHRHLIEALGGAGELARVQLVLVGEQVDPSSSELQRWIDAAGLRTRTHLLGVRHDVPQLMSAFDLYVSGSVDEGFPNAIGEAMACGVPCVVTDVGESAGLVGDTGWTVAPRQPAALRDAIAAALAEGSPALRRRGASARQRIVDHWSLGSVISQYQDLYEEMVAEARQRRRS